MFTNKLFNAYNIISRQIKYVRSFASEAGSGSKGEAKGLVVGVYDRDKKSTEGCLELSAGAYKIDEKSGGKIAKALEGLRGDIGKLGKVTMLTNIVDEFPLVAVAGLGSKKAGFSDSEYLDEQAEHIRIAAGVGARSLQKIGVNEVVVEDFNRPEAAAEGALLGAWYHSDKPITTQVTQFTDGDSRPSESSQDDWMRGVNKGECQNLVRCLCETPPNLITPRKFAERARDLLCPYGVIVTARDVRWMKENNMDALLTVGASSVEQPVYLELNYCSDPDPQADPYVLIGQGATFNSGGLCAKTCDNMLEADFASAATVLGVFKGVAAMKLPINLRGFMPLYEYVLGGLSLKKMDVIETHDFIIQTPHTNDFHTVVVGEALVHTMKNFCPERLFALGTLSPGTKAFAGAVSTVYARCDTTWQHLNYAGAVTGDRMWRMPMFKDYHQEVTGHSNVDIFNIGKSEPGEPCLIAATLNALTPECYDFTFIDITGSSAVANGYVPYLAKGMFTGAPTRGLIQTLCHLEYCRRQTHQAKSSEATNNS